MRAACRYAIITRSGTYVKLKIEPNNILILSSSFSLYFRCCSSCNSSSRFCRSTSVSAFSLRRIELIVAYNALGKESNSDILFLNSNYFQLQMKRDNWSKSCYMHRRGISAMWGEFHMHVNCSNSTRYDIIPYPICSFADRVVRVDRDDEAGQKASV